MSETPARSSESRGVSSATAVPSSERRSLDVAEPSDPPPPRSAPVSRAARGPRLLRFTLWTLLFVVLAAMPFYLAGEWLRVGTYVMIGAVGAIGLTLLTGQAGQLSLAHAFFLFIGGMSYCVLAGTGESAVSEERLIGLGLPPLLALVGAVAVAALLGLLFAPVSGRLRGIYLGVASLSLVFIGLYLGQSLPALSGGTASGRPAPDLTVFGFEFTGRDPELTLLGVPLRDNERLWYLFLALTVIAYVLATGAVRGRPGRAWRAVRDNEASASVMGVSVLRTKATAFAISSGYAGLAGAMTVMWIGILKPDESEFAGTFSIVVSISFLAMVIIGGLGSVPGAVFGALLVNGLPQVLQLLIQRSDPVRDFFSGGTVGGGGITPVILTAFVYGAAIIAVVLFEPGGLAAIGRRIQVAVRSRASGSKSTTTEGR